jgi:hypothetical protein
MRASRHVSNVHRFCSSTCMPPDRRTEERRKTPDRRNAPSRTMDVTRLEHEILCDQVDELSRILRRIEGELQLQGERISRLESERADSSTRAAVAQHASNEPGPPLGPSEQAGVRGRHGNPAPGGLSWNGQRSAL